MSALRFLRKAAPSFKGRLPEGFVRSFAKPTGPVPRPLNPTNPIVGPARSTPIVTPGTNKNLIQQMSQYGGRGLQALGAVDVADKLRKGNYGGAALEATMLFPGKTLGAARSLFLNPVAAGTGLTLAATELLFPARTADGTMDSPEAKRAEELYRTQQYDREQGADLDMGAIRNLPGGSANPLPPFNPNQDLPASAEQSLDPTPLQHQMAIYEQGRNAAQTQAERDQVRDLGLAIHKAHNPHLYSNFQTPMVSDKPFNPSLAGQPTAVFPDSYPETLEAFVKEGGVQMPQTMNNADAREAVVQGNRLEGEARAARLVEDLQAQEFMKKFLSTQTGAK